MMHKSRRLLILAIIFIVYNVLAFVIPFQRVNVFWIAYSFSVISVLTILIADWIAFRDADSLRRVFFGLPVLKIAYGSLFVQLIVCAILMITSSFISVPVWLAVIPCTLIISAGALGIVKADWARVKIEQIDTQHVENTRFIQEFRINLESLIPRVTDSALKTKIEKLSEAVRHSDPVSNEGLSDLENEMELKLVSLKQAIFEGNADGDEHASEISFLLNERNQKCRLLKRQQYQA